MICFLFIKSLFIILIKEKILKDLWFKKINFANTAGGDNLVSLFYLVDFDLVHIKFEPRQQWNQSPENDSNRNVHTPKLTQNHVLFQYLPVQGPVFV